MGVAVVMGSKSDLELVRGALDTLDSFGVGYCARVISAHRTPAEAAAFAREIDESDEYQVVICAAGMAAHLGGVLASYTTKPIVAIPVPSAPFGAADALLSIVQMPPGVPVAAVTAGKAGGKNAALYAISILALNDKTLAAKLRDFRGKQHDQVLAADAELQKELGGK